ncbi:MAG: 4-alpha-glucanotransferase [Candidatus Omnitrophica bacterium]|nr:4-alpha-glucanotransferase [Candidatus Omnitrophota bacterium]
MFASDPETSKDRRSGILLHLSSLPSAFGIGDAGPAAYRFVDFCYKAGQTYWQILPLNPVVQGFGNSPYSSISAFAADPLFISPECLIREGLCVAADLHRCRSGEQHPERTDYEAVRALKMPLLQSAFQQFKNASRFEHDYAVFCKEENAWLDDFALFIVLRAHFKEQSWTAWTPDIRHRLPVAVAKYRAAFAEEIYFQKFLQFIFHRQWKELKEYARHKNVKIIGDIPIYVSLDSVDVWSNPSMFQLDAEGQPLCVAGVPPDYFSQTGQRWGNPVYNWTYLKDNHFAWWVDRLRHNFRLYDVARIDHFRGLVGYWAIPAAEPTAVNGQWEPVPYEDFFQTLTQIFSRPPIIAEDLGILTDDVKEVMARYHFPGMRILLFAFSGDQETHPYLPHNYVRNCVVYTGTHDNNTVRGWFENEASPEEIRNLNAYLKREVTCLEVPWLLIRLAMNSRARLSLFPLQDILGLGKANRMNTPATTQGNWQWRFLENQLTDDITVKLRELTHKAQRC